MDFHDKNIPIGVHHSTQHTVYSVHTPDTRIHYTVMQQYASVTPDAIIRNSGVSCSNHSSDISDAA